MKNCFAEKRSLRSLYSPKAARVLRVLLEEPQRPWKVQDLAAEADISLGQTSNVKKLLGDREWLRTGAGGIRLSEPQALLAEWAENQTYRRDRQYPCYSLAPVRDQEPRLAEVCTSLGVRYALTAFSSALRLAPMVRTDRMDAYVMGDVELIMKQLQLKPVDSGANIMLIEPGDEGVFYGARDVDGLAMVSPLQAYLDLIRAGGRGQEAADAILHTVIRPQW